MHQDNVFFLRLGPHIKRTSGLALSLSILIAGTSQTIAGTASSTKTLSLDCQGTTFCGCVKKLEEAAELQVKIPRSLCDAPLNLHVTNADPVSVLTSLLEAAGYPNSAITFNEQHRELKAELLTAEPPTALPQAPSPVPYKATQQSPMESATSSNSVEPAASAEELLSRQIAEPAVDLEEKITWPDGQSLTIREMQAIQQKAEVQADPEEIIIPADESLGQPEVRAKDVQRLQQKAATSPIKTEEMEVFQGLNLSEQQRLDAIEASKKIVPPLSAEELLGPQN